MLGGLFIDVLLPVSRRHLVGGRRGRAGLGTRVSIRMAGAPLHAGGKAVYGPVNAGGGAAQALCQLVSPCPGELSIHLGGTVFLLQRPVSMLVHMHRHAV